MNDVIMLMEQVPSFYFGTVLILGLLIGSFLNVVIYRLPVMMERSWKAECKECFPDADIEVDETPFNLVLPRSRCPKCNHLIGSLENIPLVSWLIQKGRCKHCDCNIPARYPCIEILTGLMSLAVAYLLPLGWPVLFALIFTWVLISLTFIDFDTMLITGSTDLTANLARFIGQYVRYLYWVTRCAIRSCIWLLNFVVYLLGI